MNKPKHTPGPWTYGEYFVVPAMATGDDGRFSIAKVFEPVYHPTGAHREEVCANARLIAAAPDMLAALEAIAEAANAGVIMSGDDYTRDARLVMSQARTAIAKAKGEA